MSDRIPVAISGCLLGNPVRYDGGHRRQDVLVALEAQVEWIAVCPEVGAGFGTPREPMHLEGTKAGLRLFTNDTGQDRTDDLVAYADAEIARLVGLGVRGFVGKSRSPSCGADTTPVHAGSTVLTDSGLFVQRIRFFLPGLPIAHEEQLAQADARESFIRSCSRYDRPRS